MDTRVVFIRELVDTVDQMVLQIEEQEQIEPDLAIVRELAEQLKLELQLLE